jgi:signal peptidase I
MRFSARKVAEQFAVVATVTLIVWGVLVLCRPVRVSGSSMEPALKAGDLVIVHRRDRVEVRDIVLYREQGHGPVLHRVIGRGADGSFRTKGDANSVADRTPIPESAVVGPVRAIVPVGRMVAWWRAR